MEMLVEMAKHLETLMEQYGTLVFQALSTHARPVFSSLFGLWLLIEIIFKGMVQGTLTLTGFLRPFLTGSLVLFLLSLTHFLEWLYHPLRRTCSEVILVVLQALAADIVVRETTIHGALYALHQAFHTIFISLEGLMKEGGWVLSLNHLASLLLRVPFMMLWGVVLCYSLTFLFKIMVLTALAPLLIIYGAFPATRFIPWQGVKMVMQGTLTVVISLMAMGLSLYLLQQTVHHLQAAPQESFAFSEAYWGCFMTACLSVYLQLQAPVIASIVGFQEGAGAATFTTGLLTGGVTAALRGTRRWVQGTLSGGLSTLGERGEAAFASSASGVSFRDTSRYASRTTLSPSSPTPLDKIRQPQGDHP